MVFSSPIFLFLFLPLILGVYLLSGRSLRNAVLFGASVLFYTWGEPYHFWLLLLSIGLNYAVGLRIGAADEGLPARRRKRWLAAGVAINLLLLGHFKYANFLVENLNVALGLAGAGPVASPGVHLPIGISFFTFQAVSYLVDVYRGVSLPQRSALKLGLYISMFPQLIAGPIVRYEHVAAEMEGRTLGLAKWSVGVRRFVLGLAKKVFIANTMGAMADSVMTLPPGEITTALAWVGALAYTMQIFYDFSGYSDMAIGLGLIFGFKFPENFNYPYIARSIQEFWRRWHITLSTWFRDYLYIPLGGNRRGPWRTYANLFMVFLLTGVWHGASWNFIVWGLFHGAFMMLERAGLKRGLDALPAALSMAYCCFVVVVGWVYFRIPDLADATEYVGVMLGLAGDAQRLYTLDMYMTREFALTFLLAVVFAAPTGPWLERRLEAVSTPTGRRLATGAQALFMAGLLFIAVIYTASATYNPFIYFQF